MQFRNAHVEHQEFSIPRHPQAFPALAKCMVIESSFQARKYIVNLLKDSGLFPEVIEPETLAEGLEILQTQEIDVSCIGLSVSIGAAKKFIRAGAHNARGQVAFLVIAPSLEEQAGLEEAGAHAVVEVGTGKRTFCLGVIQAVKRANSNSPWANFSDHDLLNQDSKSQTTYAAHIPKMCKKVQEPAIDLQELVNGLEAGRYVVTDAGTPCQAALKSIRLLVDGTIPRGSRDTNTVNSFKHFFERAISEWFVELATCSKNEATAKLKTKLMSFEG